jgi:hypothetical protein
MVLACGLPHAAERFTEVLEEYTRPIGAGDVIVLYTDGNHGSDERVRRVLF